MCTTVSLPWSIGLFCGNIENKYKQVILSKIFMLLMTGMCKNMCRQHMGLHVYNVFEQDIKYCFTYVESNLH